MGWVLIRDTKQAFDSATDYRLGFRADQFDALQTAIRAHDLRSATVPAGVLDGLAIDIVRVSQDVNVLYSTIAQPGVPKGAALLFNDAEIAAFFDGVHQHEFDVDGDFTEHAADCAADCAQPAHVAMVAAV
jgi:hypothetical protein